MRLSKQNSIHPESKCYDRYVSTNSNSNGSQTKAANANNTNSSQLKRVVHHSNQKGQSNEYATSFHHENASSTPLITAAASSRNVTQQKEAVDFASMQQNHEYAAKSDKNPCIKRNFAENSGKLFKETSFMTHLTATPTDKDSVLSLVESSAATTPTSDVDAGNEHDFANHNNNANRSKYNDHFFSIGCSVSVPLLNNTTNNNSKNSNATTTTTTTTNTTSNTSAEVSMLNHSKVTFDPKLEFI